MGLPFYMVDIAKFCECFGIDFEDLSDYEEDE